MKKTLTFVSFLALNLLFSACRKEEPLLIENRSQLAENNFVFKEGAIVMGETLENPYSVENMQKAYENLQNQSGLKSNIKIDATHFYVRFRPKSEIELELLRSDTTLDIFDYPLDAKIKQGGTYYHAPGIPANEITWQYTVVPVNYSFPKIQYQKLADLYLPLDGGDSQTLKNSSIDYSDWSRLETEALRMTGNLEENQQEGNRLKASSWRPSGSIYVFDDILKSNHTVSKKVFDHWEYYDCGGVNPEDPPAEQSLPFKTTELQKIEPVEQCQRAVYRYETVTSTDSYIPMGGVQVRATRWFTTHKGYTDTYGNYTCDGTFERDANYEIKWERWDYDIRDGSYGQAYYTGPKQTGEWNVKIEKNNSKSFLFAHIFRAAHLYYYGHTRWGIMPPPKKGNFLNQRLHIAGKDKEGRSHYFGWNAWVFSATVVIYSSQESTNGTIYYYDSRDMFGTTIHELTHASHWENKGFNDASYFLQARIAEAWAVGVEWKITNDIYYEAFNNGNIYEDGYQYKDISWYASKLSEGYTPLVIDLIDDVNQHIRYSYISSMLPNDEASGYTLSQIESALPGTFGSWWVWRDNILRDYENPTEEKVNYLFQTYK